MTRSLPSKLAIAVLLFLFFGFFAFLALPRIVNALLLESFLQRLPFSDSRAALSTITMSSASGSVELEHQGKPLVSVPKFTLSYSPASLLDGRTKSLTIEHGVFHLYRDGGVWGVSGIQLAPGGSLSESTPPAASLPIGVDAVLLDDCRIVLHEPGERAISIGASGKIKISYEDLKERTPLKSIYGSIALSSDVTAAVTISLIFDRHQIEARIGLKDALMPALGRFFPSPVQSFEFGVLDADLDMVADKRSFDALHYRLNGSLREVSYAHEQAVLPGGARAEDFKFEMTGDRSRLEYDISSMVAGAPLQAHVAVSGEAQLDAGKLDASGTLKAQIGFADQADAPRLPAVLNYRAAWTKSAGLLLETEGRLQPEEAFTLPEALIGGSAGIELDELGIASRLQLHNDQLQSRISLGSGPFALEHRDLSLNGSDLQVHAALDIRRGQASARIDGSAGRLSLLQKQLSVAGLQFSLPIALAAAPASGSEQRKGAIAIDSVSINGEPVASLSTDISLNGMTYRADGSLKSPAAPNGRLRFTATVSPRPASAVLSWELIPVKVSSRELAPFGVAPHDFAFDALLAAGGEIELAESGLSGSMTASIHEGTLQSEDKKIILENIDCFIEFPELPRLLSRPGQRCTVSSLDISSLHFSDAEFIFRLEDPPALFIEKSKLNWCDGTLESGSMRLAKGTPGIDTVFYGSQINLGQLLEQFGFKISEGEGSLNGKLPVKISRETVEFDGGFLFSTPGTGGIVRFTDTELLRRGIGGVKEAGSVGYTLQALEDFSYNWTKLTFDTKIDELLMTLELDGKPRTALPFEFDKNGVIVESKKGAGLQYPIRLDLNVRLPLAELFKIGRSFNSIMENNR